MKVGYHSTEHLPRRNIYWTLKDKSCDLKLGLVNHQQYPLPVIISLFWGFSSTSRGQLFFACPFLFQLPIPPFWARAAIHRETYHHIVPLPNAGLKKSCPDTMYQPRKLLTKIHQLTVATWSNRKSDSDRHIKAGPQRRNKIPSTQNTNTPPMLGFLGNPPCHVTGGITSLHVRQAKNT